MLILVSLAYGQKYSLQKFMLLDLEDLIRKTQMVPEQIDLAHQCVASAFFPLARRQTTGKPQGSTPWTPD